MTFDEALAYRKRMKLLPVDEEDFRHGWNAAITAAMENVGGVDNEERLRDMCVEVKT